MIYSIRRRANPRGVKLEAKGFGATWMDWPDTRSRIRHRLCNQSRTLGESDGRQVVGVLPRSSARVQDAAISPSGRCSLVSTYRLDATAWLGLSPRHDPQIVSGRYSISKAMGGCLTLVHTRDSPRAGGNRFGLSARWTGFGYRPH